MSSTVVYSNRSDVQLNREARHNLESGLSSALVNERVGKVYAYTAAALAASALSATAFAKTGLAATLLTAMNASPLASGLALLAISVGLIYATLLTPKEHSSLRHGCYGLFTVAQGLVLSPLVLINAKAFALATASSAALTGGLGALAMNLRESFERYERILMVSLGALCCISLGSLLLPTVAAAFAHQVSYVGGFALFSAFVIYDTHKARSEATKPEFDVIKHSMEVYLDAINLLIRCWEFFNKKNN